MRRILLILGTMGLFGASTAGVFRSPEIDKSTTAVKYKSCKFSAVETQIEI